MNLGQEYFLKEDTKPINHKRNIEIKKTNVLPCCVIRPLFQEAHSDNGVRDNDSLVAKLYMAVYKLKLYI